MPTLPSDYLSLIQIFAPHFSNFVWQHAQVLLIGAILVPGRRTVTAVLRIMGLSEERQFQTYHRVLSRAAWSSWALSRTLLRLLVQTFVPTGPIICGLDDTIERRRGAKIKAKGIYRDPVRSSHGHFVKASGLRWLSLMLLAPIPWANRTWALPFLTCLAPSERFYAKKARAHKKLTDWGRQMVMQLRRWLPERQLVTLAPERKCRCRRRQQFCRDFVAVSVVAVARAHLPDCPLSDGCRLVRARTQTAPRSTGTDACERPTPADLGAGRSEQQNEMAAGHNPQLVWSRAAYRRDRLEHGRVVSQRSAPAAHPLGLDP